MATTLTLPEAARRLPGVTSVATRDIPEPDFADVTLVDLPPGAPTDPAIWAREVFALGSLPGWVKVLMGLRQALVGLVGIERGRATAFDIDEHHGNEVLISDDANHLDFRLGVAIDLADPGNPGNPGDPADPGGAEAPGAGMVRVTTVVREKGRRGRLYMRVVRVFHPPVLRSMLDRTARRLAPPSGP